jgi:hypothetical protein
MSLGNFLNGRYCFLHTANGVSEVIKIIDFGPYFMRYIQIQLLGLADEKSIPLNDILALSLSSARAAEFVDNQVKKEEDKILYDSIEKQLREYLSEI